MKKNKIEGKKMKRKENKNKSLFSLLLLEWNENGEKENEKYFFLLLDWR